MASSDNVIDLVISLDALSAAANNNPVAQLAAFNTVKEIKVTPLLNVQGLQFPAQITAEERREQLAAIVSEGVAVTGADQCTPPASPAGALRSGSSMPGSSATRTCWGRNCPPR